MKFWEAMKAFEEGKKVRCKHWEPTWHLHKDGGNPWSNRLHWYFNDNLRTLELYYCVTAEWELFEESLSTSAPCKDFFKKVLMDLGCTEEEIMESRRKMRI